MDIAMKEKLYRHLGIPDDAPEWTALREERDRVARFKALQGSEPYLVQLRRVQQVALEFAASLGACVTFASREPGKIANSLALQSVDDLIETALIAAFAVREGARNPARRELRFLLELAVKTTYVDQAQEISCVLDDRLAAYKRIGNSSGIDEAKHLRMWLLDESSSRAFRTDVARTWGVASSYVHPTHRRLLERLQLREQGVTIGYDTVEELESVAEDMFSALSLCLVMILHALDPQSVGDLMETFRESRPDWIFYWSPWLAEIDKAHDYKFERQPFLEALAKQRADRRSCRWGLSLSSQ